MSCLDPEDPFTRTTHETPAHTAKNLQCVITQGVRDNCCWCCCSRSRLPRGGGSHDLSESGFSWSFSTEERGGRTRDARRRQDGIDQTHACVVMQCRVRKRSITAPNRGDSGSSSCPASRFRGMVRYVYASCHVPYINWTRVYHRIDSAACKGQATNSPLCQQRPVAPWG